jgi:hypothetical protein
MRQQMFVKSKGYILHKFPDEHLEAHLDVLITDEVGSRGEA